MNYQSFTGTFATVGSLTPSGYGLDSLVYTDTELDAVTKLAPVPMPSTPSRPATPRLPDPLVITMLQRTPLPGTTPMPASGMPPASNHGHDNLSLPPATGGLPNGHRIPPLGVELPWELYVGKNDPQDPLDTKHHPLALAGHGQELFEVDGVLAGDLDNILRVQMGPYAVAFEREALSGASIVRALLTGTTPRTDLLAQGSQVASVATLMMNTDVNVSPGAPAEPTDGNFGLPNFLIDPLLEYPVSGPPEDGDPTGPISQAAIHAARDRAPRATLVERRGVDRRRRRRLPSRVERSRNQRETPARRQRPLILRRCMELVGVPRHSPV